MISKIYLNFFLFFSLVVFSQLSYSQDWGADPVDPSYRPSTNWQFDFLGARTVNANNYTNIEEAITACSSSNYTGYCTVEVPGGNTYEAFFLNRSKTRIIGIGSSRPIINYTTNGTSHSYVWIENSGTISTEKIIIENLALKPEWGFGADQYIGIMVTGENLKDIIIRNNLAQNLVVTDFNNGNRDQISWGEGQVIGIEGTGTISISDVTLDNNSIINAHTGDSEIITISGNVKNWQIINNHLSDIYNIGIAADGGYHPDLDYNLDIARYGFIENNVINNFRYMDDDGPAAAIYVNGAQYIHIENNTVQGYSYYNQNTLGYAIGAEECSNAKHITLINNSNVSFNSSIADIYTGAFYIGNGSYTGYNKNDPSTTAECDVPVYSFENDGRGYVDHITIKNNNFDRFSNSSKVRLTHAVIQEMEGLLEVNVTQPSPPGNENSIKFAFVPVEANSNAFTVITGRSITMDVLANDTGSGLMLGWFDPPSNGTMIKSNGNFIYTPNAGFTGTENLWYQAVDSAGLDDWGNLVITITNNGSFEANGDSFSVIAGKSITMDVLANDTGAGLILGWFDSPSNGTMIKSTGKFIYTPNAGFTGTEDLWYQAVDSSGLSDWGHLIITVN